MLALIPARSGSVRLPDKNIKLLSGHPLIAYTISAALESGLFSKVVVCTDSSKYAQVAEHYGALVPSLRPTLISGSNSPDREWIQWLFSLKNVDESIDKYACILRPTNPFRTVETIQRAHRLFCASSADTLRAVRKVAEHPGKMWIKQGEHIVPLIPLTHLEVPMHSNQTAALFDVYIQDASLEIFTIDKFKKLKQITGSSILPFHCIGNEGLDINYPKDFEQAERIASDNSSPLPEIKKASFQFKS